MNDNLMIDFTAPCGRYLLTFEDDGKVAYAYLKNTIDREIVGHVWLYNSIQTPEVPEWTDRSKIPFLNPLGYADHESWVKRKVEFSDVIVDWEYEENQPVAYIYVFEDLYGVVGVGDKPGYARHAVCNNPLAKVMEIVD